MRAAPRASAARTDQTIAVGRIRRRVNRLQRLSRQLHEAIIPLAHADPLWRATGAGPMRDVLLLLKELRGIEASFSLMLPADQAAIDRFVVEQLAVRVPIERRTPAELAKLRLVYRANAAASRRARQRKARAGQRD